MIDHVFVKNSFVPQLQGAELVPPSLKIVSWFNGTDEEIVDMLDAHYNGDINIHEHWNVGDIRKIQLPAIYSEDLNETIPEQEIELQLVNAGGKELINGNTCVFVVQLKDVMLNGNNQIHRIPLNRWHETNRREWCNTEFYNAFPSTIRGIFKQHKNTTGQALVETTDYFSLPCEYNVFGVKDQAYVAEDSVHWSYYSSSSNRYKNLGGTTTKYGWWLRSPSRSGSGILFVNEYGSIKFTSADRSYGIAPFGCI